MLEKQDQMISLQHETVDEIRGLRTDTVSFYKEFSEIKRDLTQSRQLSAMQEYGYNPLVTHPHATHKAF
jgi:hypothetical protein